MTVVLGYRSLLERSFSFDLTKVTLWLLNNRSTLQNVILTISRPTKCLARPLLTLAIFKKQFDLVFDVLSTGTWVGWGRKVLQDLSDPTSDWPRDKIIYGYWDFSRQYVKTAKSPRAAISFMRFDTEKYGGRPSFVNLLMQLKSSEGCITEFKSHPIVMFTRTSLKS